MSAPDSPPARVADVLSREQSKRTGTLDLSGADPGELDGAALQELARLAWLTTLRASRRGPEVAEAVGGLRGLRELWLDGNRLQALPEALCGLLALEVLALQDNLLASLPAALGRLRGLRVLMLHRNQLEVLPASVGDLAQLQALALHGNRLRALPASVAGLQCLQSLTLDDNRLAGVLQPALARLAALTRLSVGGNPDLEALPADLGAGAFMLRELDVRGCARLGALPASLSSLMQLERLHARRCSLPAGLPAGLFTLVELDVSHSGLRALPADLQMMFALRVLNASHNALAGELPPCLGLLAVEHVDVSHNRLTRVSRACLGASLRALFLEGNPLREPLPVELWALPQLAQVGLPSLPVDLFRSAGGLRQLLVADSQLAGLPGHVQQLEQLEALRLSSAVRLLALPPQLAFLPQLRTLIVDGARLLRQLPGRLPTVEELGLVGCDVRDLPPARQMPRLRKFTLRDAAQPLVPPQLWGCRGLRVLKLNRNGLRALSSSVALLSFLEELDVSRNQIAALPTEVGALVQLRVLDASANRLTGLPETLGDLLRLERLALHDNPGLASLPASLARLRELRVLSVDPAACQPPPPPDRVCPQCGDATSERRHCGLVPTFRIVGAGRVPKVGDALADGRFTVTATLMAKGPLRVMLATDTHTRQQVTIKLLVPGDGRRYAHGVVRLVREAETCRLLQHPAVVGSLGAFQEAESGLVFMACELAHGESLRQTLDRHEGGRLPVPLACVFLCDVLDVLQAMQDDGFAHGNLSLTSIIVEEPWRPKLVNFGPRSDLPLAGQAPTPPTPQQVAADVTAASNMVCRCLLGGQTEEVGAAALGRVLPAPVAERVAHAGSLADLRQALAPLRPSSEAEAEALRLRTWVHPPGRKRRVPKLDTSLAAAGAPLVATPVAVPAAAAAAAAAKKAEANAKKEEAKAKKEEAKAKKAEAKAKKEAARADKKKKTSNNNNNNNNNNTEEKEEKEEHERKVDEGEAEAEADRFCPNCRSPTAQLRHCEFDTFRVRGLPAADGAARNHKAAPLNGRFRVGALLTSRPLFNLHRGTDLQQSRPCVLKLIAPSGDFKSAIVAVAREAEVSLRVSHPGVVSVYEVGQLPDGTAFMAFELVDGLSVRQLLQRQRRPLTEEQGLLFCVSFLDALVAVHAAGLVHGNISPASVMILDGWRAKVVNFAFHRQLPARGTPGPPAREAAVDVRAAASVAYSCFTNRPTGKGGALDDGALQGVSSAVALAVRRAISREASALSVTEFRDALAACLPSNPQALEEMREQAWAASAAAAGGESRAPKSPTKAGKKAAGGPRGERQ